jgi:hypothetical protein
MPAFIYIPALSGLNPPGKTPEKKLAAFGDEAITGAVEGIKERFDATLLDCGRQSQLRWVAVELDKEREKDRASGVRRARKGPPPDKKYIWELVGTPKENMLSKVAGLPAKAPTETVPLEDYGTNPPKSDWKIFLAQPSVSKTAAATGPVKGAGSYDLPELPPLKDELDGGAGELPTLEDVRDDDILFIIGHGNARGGALMYNKFAKPKSAEVNELYIVDPTTLATQLQDEGLPDSHKVIHAFMCFGGGIADETLQTVQPFAQRLAGDLKAGGYKKIKVVGATGILIGSTFRVRRSLEEDRENNRYLIMLDTKAYEASLKSF